MSRMIFVNTFVADVAATRQFFAGLGFDFIDQFSDESTASMVVSDQAIVMFLSRDKFQSFIKDGLADTSQVREALFAISADSREEVDQLVDAAIAAGGSDWNEAQDMGFMYGRSFLDLDHHVWEVVWMDPSVASGEQAPPDMA